MPDENLVLKLMQHVQDLLERHMRKVEESHTGLCKTIEENKTASEKRHAELTGLFTKFADNQKLCVPGQDHEAHRKAHEEWMAKVETEMARWEYIRKEVLKWIILGSLGFIAVAAWTKFLQGPAG